MRFMMDDHRGRIQLPNILIRLKLFFLLISGIITSPFSLLQSAIPRAYRKAYMLRLDKELSEYILLVISLSESICFWYYTFFLFLMSTKFYRRLSVSCVKDQYCKRLLLTHVKLVKRIHSNSSTSFLIKRHCVTTERPLFRYNNSAWLLMVVHNVDWCTIRCCYN